MDIEVIDDTLSISPRKTVPYTYDTLNAKEIEKVIRKQQCEKLVSLIYLEVLKNKPNTVLDYIVTKILIPGGPADKLKTVS